MTQIWQFIDGKPGHISQSDGLITALTTKLPSCHVERLDVRRTSNRLRDWVCKRFPLGEHLASPQLLIGAGHRTHLALLAARRRYGGKIVVLMKPSLPMRWFDCCLIPAHDEVPAGPHVVLTRGPLNAMQTHGDHSTDRGLILLGGPSAHAHWDSNAICQQVEQLVRAQPQVNFSLSTSRRTPSDVLPMLDDLRLPNLELHPGTTTPQGWVAQQLSASAQAWISIDSASMIYEALSAGVGVGILQLQPHRNSRVISGLQRLQQDGLITLFEQWRNHATSPLLSPSPSRFNEAERCAELLLQRWPELAA